ncbi:CRAL-TRIO domain-containing protein C3H8.02 [Fusarium oxysporum f. sp. cubense race 1]|uniref:CRAL-TRIO domain-containing protein C3H8.02 n=1 Tax=Fusarium oxysporum f. sp. cubense (strain race 1) TaxID=1229664 RepID=N4TNE2_FUSC1|nr:CRAL-TRIO domain-containing protein C3H8.02 [Fusarium oxysporum f. sp. cubense race 1]
MRTQLGRNICSYSPLKYSSQPLSRHLQLRSSVLSSSLLRLPLTNSRGTPASARSIASARYLTGSRNLTHSIVIKRTLYSKTGSNPSSKLPLEANSLYSVVVAVAVITAVVAISAWPAGSPSNQTPPEEFEEEFEIMSFQSPPGRPGNLTPEQEEKLRKLWTAVFQLTGVADDESAGANLLPQKEEASPAEADPKKKRGFGMFKKGKSGTSTPTEGSAEEDKYNETKQFHETLANESPETIRHTIWSMVKHDHPDALVLRFLRARKWDVEKALVMLVSTMHWRHNDMKVDSEIMKNGDAFAVEDEKTDSPTKQVSADMMKQLRMGKSFLHGTDKQGRPICVVRVRLHKAGQECEESLEKYTVYIIETARMTLQPPVDTACIVFDMTGFSMANMDYTPVKFMIKCFEANYPESLGAVLVHKAPWLFQGIWKVIRGWLDPVVAAKVHFTNNRAELEEFIAPDHLIKELEGDENWEYKYIEPIAGENDKMKDTHTRDRLLTDREELVKKFEHTTREWIRHPDGEQGKQLKAEREKIAKLLREDYWNLDPYIRARTLYDRQGAIQSDGKTDWYSLKPLAAAGASTSADDLD